MTNPKTVSARERDVISAAWRLYRITEVALHKAQREGRFRAAERLKRRLTQRWNNYKQAVWPK